MFTIKIVRGTGVSISEQISGAIYSRIADRFLRAGQQLPSLRTFAKDHSVSVPCVLEAYDRLIAKGVLEAHKGKGFFVREQRSPRSDADPDAPPESPLFGTELHGQAAQTRCPNTSSLLARIAGGWLPPGWVEHNAIKRALLNLARKETAGFSSIPDLAGYLPLREQLRVLLSELEIRAGAGQIVTTTGVTHGLDLVCRAFVRPGDRIAVEDPGHFLLFDTLKHSGATLAPVPRDHRGLILERLEETMATRPKIFFLNPILHNPTGQSLSMEDTHHVLRLAEQYGVLLVENAACGDLSYNNVRLAAMGGLRRVIYVAGFSETVSPWLRVGYIAAGAEYVEPLLRAKLGSLGSTSELCERVLAQILGLGTYRRTVQLVRPKIMSARAAAIANIEKSGFTVSGNESQSPYIWARAPFDHDTEALARQAYGEGMFFAPGKLFRPEREVSPFVRFNVGNCMGEAFAAELTQLVAQAQARPPAAPL